MAGKYRLTFFQNRQAPRVARPGDPATRAQPGDGAHVQTRLSTTSEETQLEVSSRPANPLYAQWGDQDADDIWP